MSEFESPSMIENIMAQALESITKNEKGEAINFADFNEIATTIAKQLRESGFVSLKEGTRGERKVVSSRVMVNGEAKILKLEFVFDSKAVKSYLKSIEVKGADTLN